MNTDYASHLSSILESRLSTSPRGLPTKEVIGSTFRWDMSRPLILDPMRKLNFTHSFGEAAWIISGDNSLVGIRQYLKKWEDFSDDGVTLNGAYGPPFREQMSYIIKTLSEDRFSRQAVLTIWRQRPGQSKDIPCTVALQFLIREGALHVIASMRSSDAWWGLPYDISTFSFMAYAVAIHLPVIPKLGNGVLNIGSAHIYENFFTAARELISANTLQLADYNLSPEILGQLNKSERLEVFISRLRYLANECRSKDADVPALTNEVLGSPTWTD